MLSFSVLLEYYPEKKIQKSEASFEVSVFGEVTAVPVLCAILHILSEHEVKLVKRMVEYTLYYKNILIGTIIQSNEEFPNLHGSLDFKNNNLPQKIVDYINYSIENSGLFEEDEEKWENHMIENEKK
ncbi:MAG: hypothetical protein GY756_05150, partial [bacterium]|nr:hypothetical protein [bacterium]